nr:PREDICTED: multivesicular body subunit 12A [Bemisia tabaci]
MMQQVFKTLLPDDRPISAICIVEDISKCPPGFTAISRTFDQDSDADLWKENTFFGKKCTRYMCISKTEGIPEYIVESISVINDKQLPQDGYCLISQTIDSEQKAWRKKQMAYKLSRRNVASSAVSNIILLSRSKQKIPEGYNFIGDVNGLGLCCKFNKVEINVEPKQKCNSSTPIINGIGSAGSPTPPPRPPRASPAVNGNSFLASNSQNGDDYERLVELRPSRPAPNPPPSMYGTIASFQGLEGVPFILNPKIDDSFILDSMKGLPVIKAKTKYEIDKEYDYDFRLERQT